MAQIFHPSMNAFSKATIFGGVFILAGVAWAGNLWMRSSYVNQDDIVRDQPVPFSHDHHVSGLGIDCRYCHTTVETSAFAGIPSTEICMGCHSQIWRDSALLEPVRESYRTKRPLEWTRVHDVPDFVYFDHSIHVAKGIGCESCHGRVDRMPLMRKVHALHMEWCLDCHRHPERQVRDKQDVFKFGITATRVPTSTGGPDQATNETEEKAPADSPQSTTTSRPLREGEKGSAMTLVRGNLINTSQLTDCVICHR